MRALAFVTTALASTTYGQSLAQVGQVEWAMNAMTIDGCYCQVQCPCIFGSAATVGSAATHQHQGHRSSYFNAAFRANEGHCGKVKLDYLKFWFEGGRSDARTVERTFEPSATLNAGFDHLRPEPAPIEFRETAGWTIRMDMSSIDVAAR